MFLEFNINWFVTNPFGIAITCIVALILLIVGIILYTKYGWFRKLVSKLVDEAEEYIKGKGLGKEKKCYVINAIYEVLPEWLKSFISIEYIEKLIDKLVAFMNKRIKDNANE